MDKPWGLNLDADEPSIPEGEPVGWPRKASTGKLASPVEPGHIWALWLELRNAITAIGGTLRQTAVDDLAAALANPWFPMFRVGGTKDIPKLYVDADGNLVATILGCTALVSSGNVLAQGFLRAATALNVTTFQVTGATGLVHGLMMKLGGNPLDGTGHTIQLQGSNGRVDLVSLFAQDLNLDGSILAPSAGEVSVGTIGPVDMATTTISTAKAKPTSRIVPTLMDIVWEGTSMPDVRVSITRHNGSFDLTVQSYEPDLSITSCKVGWVIIN